jgi:hypothetical protein
MIVEELIKELRECNPKAKVVFPATSWMNELKEVTNVISHENGQVELTN